MNRKLAFATLLAALATFPAFASEDMAAPDHQEKGAVQDATAAAPQDGSSVALMSVIKKSISDSKTAIEAKDLKSIHPHTTKGAEALKALLAAVAPAPEKKERLQAAIKQMNARLDALHHAADKNDVAKTEAELKKAEGAYTLLELQVGK